MLKIPEYLRKNISKITEDCIKKLVKEGMLNDTDIESDEEGTELSSFEEYTMDYPNDDFDVSDMTPKKLARWCDNIGDFLFVYKGVRGLKVMVANSRKIVDSVIHDLNKCGSIEPSHEVDYLFEKRKNEFVNDYVCIFKIKGSPHGDYYVVYQEDKIHGNRINLGESRKYLTEAFKSNELRKWFKVHDGVKRVYNDPVYSEIEDKRVYQDGLGDVTDDSILYMEEFYDEKVPSKNGGENHEIKKSFNQAYDKMQQLKMPNRQTRQRSDWDKKAYFTVYQANDGASLLVGIDRNKMDIASTWGGGEATKKTADRKMKNGWNIKHRTNRYVDDSDTYYYSRKGRDFGISNNHKYKGALKHNQDVKSRMSDDDWKTFQDKRVKSMDSYLKNRYGKGLIRKNVEESVKKALRENIYDEQWENDIKLFIQELKNGNAFIDKPYIVIYKDENYEYPIYYKEGNDCLTNDNFSIQNSRRLTIEEITAIRNLASTYGVNITIPDDEYFDNEENGLTDDEQTWETFYHNK